MRFVPSGDDEVHFVDINKLGVNRRNGCRFGLVIIVHQLYLAA